ncbi:hypothetical protein ACYQR9_02685 [Methylobacterium sp. CM6241]|uniref:hypothetical protein n=1 Tax=unclassified Methylobacterium TaxID=2615210 RepID=UPI0009EA5109|nr:MULTISPECIES: hypothetical protein [unclassified Methylobacterium]
MRLSIYCLLAACLLAQPSLVDTASAEEVDTEHLFGFTEGADVGKKGEQEVVLDTVTRIGKRRAGPGPSSYDAVGTKLSYQIDLVDGFSVQVGLFGDHHRVRNILDLDDRNAGNFDGVSVEFKYQLVKSTPEQPFGLALESRPRFARVLPIEGRGADIFDFENVVHVDWQIVPNKLWYGTNISYDPAAGRQRGSGEGYRSSTFLWSNALVGEVADKTYLGPELRYLRGYEGIFLNGLQSEALTLGPALHHRFTEKAWITVAYAGQVWGRDTDKALANRGLGLNQFERHALRVKLGMEF